jgi:hypothetical protein
MQDALMQQQIELEKLYDKNQTTKRLRFYFETEVLQRHALDLGMFLDLNQIPRDFGFSLLVQISLHRRTDLPTMVGLMRHHFKSAQEASDAILKCCELDMLHWNPAFSQLVVEPSLQIPLDVQHELDLFQFPLPMIVEPREVKSNKDTGYVTSSGSIILKKNHHNDDVCLDHINRMNRIKFTINVDTAHMIANTWRNLDKVKEGETTDDFEKRKRAFDKYDKTAHAVIGILEGFGNEFYLTHRYDKRGRVYCQGYHVTYQGNAWNKSVLELADKEIIEL